MRTQLMSIRSFTHIHPRINPTTYVDDGAIVIGDVTIAEDSSIWPGTILRGDVNSIIIGARTSIQDGSIVHVTHRSHVNPEGFPTIIGDEVTVGHKVILHGCNIGERCLIGMGSCVMDGVIIEPDVILGAGSLVPPNKILKKGHLWLGTPAHCVRPLTEEELQYLVYSANHYVRLKNQYMI